MILLICVKLTETWPKIYEQSLKKKIQEMLTMGQGSLDLVMFQILVGLWTLIV